MISYSRFGVLFLAMGLSWPVAVGAAERDPRDSAAPDQVPAAMQSVIAYEKTGAIPTKHYKIAYVTECVTNAYCQARMKGLEPGVEKIRIRIQDVRLELQSAGPAQGRPERGSTGVRRLSLRADGGCAGLQDVEGLSRADQDAGRDGRSVDVRRC